MAKIVRTYVSLLAFLAALLVVAGAVALLTEKPSGASASHNLTGFAWSDKVGWISFNCTNLNECGSSNYGVTIDTTTGEFRGYAWNSEVGWIHFEPNVAPGLYPEDPKEDARADTATGAVTGWARALPTPFWDGWIKLSGTWTNGATVPVVGGLLDGYAWGSDEVGWIDFGPDNGFGGVTFTGSFNQPPVAINDSALVNENGTVLINVLANDSDPDGDPLTVISASNPPHGTTALETNQVRYTPQANYAGADAFTYTISDGAGGEATATVGITVIECGNNVREQGEQCDGTDFGGDTCRDYGFVGGALSCSGSCTVITSQCRGAGDADFEEF